MIKSKCLESLLLIKMQRLETWKWQLREIRVPSKISCKTWHKRCKMKSSIHCSSSRPSRRMSHMIQEPRAMLHQTSLLFWRRQIRSRCCHHRTLRKLVVKTCTLSISHFWTRLIQMTDSMHFRIRRIHSWSLVKKYFRLLSNHVLKLLICPNKRIFKKSTLKTIKSKKQWLKNPEQLNTNQTKAMIKSSSGMKKNYEIKLKKLALNEK